MATQVYSQVWETFGSHGDCRLAVPGGWLLRDISGGLTFLPDSNSQWSFRPSLPANPAPPIPVPVVLKPDAIQGFYMVAGVWQSVQGWQQDIACLQYNLPPLTYGNKVSISLTRVSKYPRVGNWKWLRIWKDRPGAYPNLYIGQPYDGWTILYTEKLEIKDGTTRFSLPSIPYADGLPHKEEYFFRAPSACGVSDGVFQISFDGKMLFETKSLQMDSTDYPGIPNIVCLQDDPSNQTPLADSSVSISDVKIQVVTV